MFAIPCLVGLLLHVYVRPQEIFPVLQGVPILYLLFVLCIIGFALDVRLGFASLKPGPLFWWGTAYFLWSLVTVFAKASVSFVKEATLSFVSYFLFVMISQGCRHFRPIRVLGSTLLALTLFITTVAIIQAWGPHMCFHEDPKIGHDSLVHDGRTCENRYDCYRSALDWDIEYTCERLGPLETYTVEDRVRYRGILADPNELAMVMAVSLSMAFAAYGVRPRLPQLLIAILSTGVIGLCTVLTKSRSGQLAFAVVLGVGLLRRLRWAGAIAAAVLSIPVMVLGGRSDENANMSSMQRLEAWSEGIKMFMGSPLLGVGKGQFTEYHSITAHNSFVLVLAEMGIPGIMILTGAVYFAFKSLAEAGRASAGPEGASARVWCNALIAALCPLMVSSFFLSFSHHNVFWIYLGMAGAVVAAVKTHAPSLRIPIGLKDFAIIGGINASLTVAIFAYTRWKGV